MLIALQQFIKNKKNGILLYRNDKRIDTGKMQPGDVCASTKYFQQEIFA